MFKKNSSDDNQSLLLHKLVVCHATLAHDAFDAVDVPLRDSLADIDADAVIFPDGNFLQMHADVVHVPLPRADGVVLPAEAVEVASPFPDGRLGATILRRPSRQEDGQLRVDVALHASRNLHRFRDEVDL